MLSEAAAILTYLCTTHKLTTWYPYDDDRRRAHVDQWLHWSHDETRLSTLTIFRPSMAGKQPEERHIKKFEKILAFLDKRLKDVDYIAGDLSVADLITAVEIDQLILFGCFDLSPFENVSAWIGRVQKNVSGYDKGTQALKDLHEKVTKSKM